MYKLFGPLDWGLGIASTVLLFGSVLLHEASHRAAARLCGLPTSPTTLLLFGGVSPLIPQRRSLRTELLVAVSGPAANLAVAGIAFIAMSAAAILGRPFQALMGYVALSNGLLALINFIPAVPLDAGRPLWAKIWAATGDVLFATRVCVALGQATGFCLLLAGVLLLFVTSSSLGLWLVLVGWLLQHAAPAKRPSPRRMAQMLRVEDLMRRNPVILSPEISLEEFVRVYAVGHKQPELPVTWDDGVLLGVATLARANAVPRRDWRATSVQDLAGADGQPIAVSPSDSVWQALRRMRAAGRAALPVTRRNGALVGMIRHEDVIALQRYVWLDA